MRWEYAYLRWEGPERNHRRVVEFSHDDAWEGLKPSAFFPTVRALGDDGWEMICEIDHLDEPGCYYWFKRSQG